MDNIYRFLSTDPISDFTILSLLGKNVSSTSNLNDLGVHWIQREIWKHAAPIYQDDSKFFNEVEIAPFLFYTSGAEELYTSLEMSCRMGTNVGKELFGRHFGWYPGH
jgi:hypothetical protein